MPKWGSAALAALLGLGGFAVASVGSFALTRQLDPTMATLSRNRMIAGGVVGVGGIALALKSKKPLMQNAGLALAAAGAIFAAGPTVSQLAGNLVGQTVSGIGAVINRSQIPRAVTQGAFPYRQLGMGAVSYDPSFGMGEVAMATTAPWNYSTPLD